MSDEIDRIVVRYSTDVPLEVSSFTASLGALAEQFDRRGTGTVLVVDRIEDGSVLAVMKGVAKGLVAAVDPTGGLIPFTLEVMGPFAGDWSGLLQALANYGRDARADDDLRRTDKAALKAAKTFVQPAINGNTIQVYGEGNKIVQNNINIDANVAGDITRHINHLLARLPGEDERFESEPMALYQLRDAKAGDLGFIDRFERRPRRLTFADETVKSEMLHGVPRPFDVFFFVSGKVKTARGEVASYHIERIDGVTEKDAA